MKLKFAGLALLLAMATGSSFGQTITRNFVQSFKYADVGEVANLGFGRAGDVATVPNDLVAGPDRLGTESLGALRFGGQADAVTLGDTYNFHDFWKFNGLQPGTYNLDSTLKAAGNTVFIVVQFGWFSNGSPSFIDYTVSPDGKQAHGSGSFTVDPGCDVKYCTWLHIYGIDDGTTNTGYNAKGVASVVPEPGAAALLLAGLGAVGWLARRRRAA